MSPVFRLSQVSVSLFCTGTCGQLELRGLPPFVSLEMYLANVTHNIVEILERKIDTTDLTPFHWTAFVLRPHAVQGEISARKHDLLLHTTMPIQDRASYHGFIGRFWPS